MKKTFALCIDNGGFPEALEVRKFYEVVEDLEASKEGMYRVVDESGSDYLYSEDMFLKTALPRPLEEALEAA